ncbi:hypothetical protein CGRA01v4_01716 [Colletotrichum graminicola]|nr:hypothetical protein CGRA01v4_01716 [Colletotrichum graminicola]
MTTPAAIRQAQTEASSATYSILCFAPWLELYPCRAGVGESCWSSRLPTGVKHGSRRPRGLGLARHLEARRAGDLEEERVPA